MIFKKKINKTIFKLVMGQAFLLIAFSIYTTVLLYLLVQQYHATARILAIFGILAAFPKALIMLLAPSLNNIKNNKKALIKLQILETLIIFVSTGLLLSHSRLLEIGILYLLLSIVITISGSIEIGFIPVIFQENEELIEKSVDFQYFMSSSVVIIISIISSLILMVHGSTWLLLVCCLSAPIGIVFYWMIKYDESLKLIAPSDDEVTYSYLKQMKNSLYQFTHTLPAFLIILFEAILGGITGLLFELLPLTMKELGLAVGLFAIVNAVQQVGDLAGSALAPLVKWNAPTFFACDYIISGICFICVTLPIPNMLRLILLLLAGIVMGMSGNVFEKLMYRSFNVGDISSMHALTTSTFAVFSVISYLAAWISTKTLILWQLTGALTILFGILIVVVCKKNTITDL
ncbi:hypothetical protein JOC59_000071 [Weissella beninensis]|uniref:MFS transporter n=1 Tax=Periweissella beninensis TaxID=504936 RepID=A0ABT0VHK6_9LACO|nr:hypothetical protein [Periweissella beninensis]MBM7543375.1 hypothetical protein [Periweissella beninensis]MCM2437328.1 hypothetical protein [Periweissella beninensis]